MEGEFANNEVFHTDAAEQRSATTRLSDLYKQAVVDAERWHDAYFLVGASNRVRRYREDMACHNDGVANGLAHLIAWFGDGLVADVDTQTWLERSPVRRRRSVGSRLIGPSWELALLLVAQFQSTGKLYPFVDVTDDSLME